MRGTVEINTRYAQIGPEHVVLQKTKNKKRSDDFHPLEGYSIIMDRHNETNTKSVHQLYFSIVRGTTNMKGVIRGRFARLGKFHTYISIDM